MEKDFFDNTIEKAKDILSTAYQKTDEVISIEKLRFTKSSLQTKLSKDYQKLGELYFNTIKDADNLPSDTSDIINAIKEKLILIATAEKEINMIKSKRICPVCGAYVDKDAAYCPSCGAKLIFDTKE